MYTEMLGQVTFSLEQIARLKPIRARELAELQEAGGDIKPLIARQNEVRKQELCLIDQGKRLRERIDGLRLEIQL